MCTAVFFPPLGQGFFEREREGGKQTIVSEGKCCWQQVRKWSEGRLFVIGRGCGTPSPWIGGKGPGTDTKPGFNRGL